MATSQWGYVKFHAVMSRSYDDFGESRQRRALSLYIYESCELVTVLVKRDAIDGSRMSKKIKKKQKQIALFSISQSDHLKTSNLVLTDFKKEVQISSHLDCVTAQGRTFFSASDWKCSAQ